jgi:hypothetical protein
LPGSGVSPKSRNIVESVRQQLLKRYPASRRAIDADDRLGHALYSMLCSLNDPDVTLDGWALFKVVHETDDSLESVGLMTLLPGGSAPMALRLDSTEQGLLWKAKASLRDEAWLSLSDSKRWNNVYLFANGDRALPPWVWDRSYEGVVGSQTPGATEEHTRGK